MIPNIRIRHIGFAFVVLFIGITTSAEMLGFEYPTQAIDDFTPVLIAMVGAGVTAKLIKSFKDTKTGTAFVKNISNIMNMASEYLIKSKEQKAKAKFEHDNAVDKFDEATRSH